MANTTNYNWETPDDTDLVKDGAAAIRTLGSSIDTTTKALNPSTTLGDIEYRSATANTNTRLGVGTTGQVLTVAAGVPSWATPTVGDITAVSAGTGISGGGTAGDITITNSMATAIDAKGDLVVGTGADTFSRLAAGTNNYILTADSAEATGLKWAAPSAGGGKILQVVQATYATSTTSSSTTYADTGLSASITPSAASSRILVMVNQPSLKDIGNASNGVNLRIMRGSTAILTQTFTLYTATNLALFGIVSFNFVDNPNTTSALTYKTQFANTNASAQAEVQHNSNTSILILMEIGA